jgi:hypothetical protein
MSPTHGLYVGLGMVVLSWVKVSYQRCTAVRVGHDTPLWLL